MNLLHQLIMYFCDARYKFINLYRDKIVYFGILYVMCFVI